MAVVVRGWVWWGCIGDKGMGVVIRGWGCIGGKGMGVVIRGWGCIGGKGVGCGDKGVGYMMVRRWRAVVKRY